MLGPLGSECQTSATQLWRTHWRQIVQNLKGFGSDQTLAKRCEQSGMNHLQILRSMSVHMTSHQIISSDAPVIQPSKVYIIKVHGTKGTTLQRSWLALSLSKSSMQAPKFGPSGFYSQDPESASCFSFVLSG